MYEALMAHLRECAKYDKIENTFAEAADAIENLDEICQIQAEELLSIPQWIPVSERLPEEWWPVLGLIQFHDEKEPPIQQVLWYLGNGHWRETWRGDMIESDVTHWMPLPEPPKDGDQ